MNKIRKNDEVIVLAGKDKGKRGTVERHLGDRVIVSGVNVVKKTIRPNLVANTPGGIEDKQMPIHISNVALFNGTTEKADRIGFKFVEGKKVRVFKSNGEEVEAAKAKSKSTKSKAAKAKSKAK